MQCGDKFTQDHFPYDLVQMELKRASIFIRGDTINYSFPGKGTLIQMVAILGILSQQIA